MNKIIKGYKAFNKGLTCQEFKYEVGKKYVHEGDIELCKKGFHFCENPLDVLDYYNLCESEFAEIETDGKVKGDKTKSVTNKIEIKAKLDLSAFVKASVDFLWQKCSKKKLFPNKNKVSSGDSSKLASSGDSSKLASSGDSSQLASSGDSSQLASSGDYSKLASSGNSSKLASSGDSSKLASSGNSSKLASSGNSSQLASSGDSSKLASSGNSSQLASSGNSSKLASSGDSSQLEANGIDSIVVGIGYQNKIKGKIGNWVVLVEWKNNKPICVLSAKIDGKKLKEDVWYEVKNGKFIAV